MKKSSRIVAMALVVALLSVCDAQADQLDVGDKAPDFKAQTTGGKNITLSDAKGAKAVVICFTCNNCPVAKAYEERFVKFNKKYMKQDVKFIALNVNKGETLEKMKRRAESKKFNFLYAYDASRKSAEDYGARVTPHLFLLDADGVIAYIGAFDDSMDAKKVIEHYVANAVDALLKGEKPAKAKTRAFGCTIKR